MGEAAAAGDERRREIGAADEVDLCASLYDEYAGRLYRTALRLLGRPADAEDAVHDVFVAAVRSREQVAKVDQMAAYLFAALRRRIGQMAAKDRRMRQTAVDSLDGFASVSSPAPGDDPGDHLQRALAALPLAQREVVSLKIDGELTFSEIGDVLGISPNTAASRYRYAIEKLRNGLPRRFAPALRGSAESPESAPHQRG